MTVGTPAWLASSGGAPAYDATELRVIDTLYATYDGNALGGREGVRPGGSSLAVTLSGSPTNWNVASGIVAVSGINQGSLGMYVVPVTATETGTLNAADGTFARKDILVLKVTDAENGDATRDASVVYLPGQPSATPSAPAVPGKSFLLATIDVPKSGNGSPAVTQNTKYTVASGGILPTALRPTSPYAGMTIFNLTSGLMEFWSGAAWVAFATQTPVTQAFATNGTWTKPAAARYVEVEVVGGGGAGGGASSLTAGQHSSGSGGGAGGYSFKRFAASDLPTTVSVTVGAGGTGVSGAGGNSGTASSFASATPVTANGGSGGANQTESASAFGMGGGQGGTASGGDRSISGGGGGSSFGSAAFGIGGAGGDSFYGGGGNGTGGGGNGQVVAGVAGNAYGAGGSGAQSSNGKGAAAGGAGGVGRVFVTTYF